MRLAPPSPRVFFTPRRWHALAISPAYSITLRRHNCRFGERYSGHRLRDRAQVCLMLILANRCRSYLRHAEIDAEVLPRYLYLMLRQSSPAAVEPIARDLAEMPYLHTITSLCLPSRAFRSPTCHSCCLVCHERERLHFDDARYPVKTI